MPERYRKKPVEIEAMLYDGTPTRCEEIHAWCGFQHDPEAGCDSGIYIETLEGRMLASVGDWIIRGVQGEFYPCKPDIFEATYEPVSADTRPERWCKGHATCDADRHFHGCYADLGNCDRPAEHAPSDRHLDG